MHWWPAPQIGDIVWTRFPISETNRPSFKARPSVVVETWHEAGGHAVLAAYGTSQKTDRLYPGEFLIPNTRDLAWQMSGLQLATKFDMGRFADLLYTDEWFVPPPHKPFGNSPKLGVLHPLYVLEAQAARRRVRR